MPRSPRSPIRSFSPPARAPAKRGRLRRGRTSTSPSRSRGKGHLEGARRQIDATIARGSRAPGRAPTTARASKRSTATPTRAFAYLRQAAELAPDDVPGSHHGDDDLASLHDGPALERALRAGARRSPPREGEEEEAEALAPGEAEGQVAHIDELERIELPDGFVWRPIRRRFGIRAFGVNAYSAREAGGPIVEEHTEEQLGHEEIYLVLRGRVRFTVDGNEHELGPLKLVFVSDTQLRRGAIALDEDAVVLALGGKPGEPHEVSAWETMFAAAPAMQEERWDDAIRLHEQALAERPDHPALLYNLACMEARGGRPDDALRHLQRAVELEPKWAAEAAGDSDFDSIRDEPDFPTA